MRKHIEKAHVLAKAADAAYNIKMHLIESCPHMPLAVVEGMSRVISSLSVIKYSSIEEDWTNKLDNVAYLLVSTLDIMADHLNDLHNR
jgi:hypothetical protein